MLVNLAYLIEKPTGTTAYALNVLPHLQALSPIYLATPASQLNPRSDRYIPVPANMSQGTSGHLRRLWWTQFQLAKLCQQQAPKSAQRSSLRGALPSPLLFCPIPEAPLTLGVRRYPLVVTFHDVIPLRFPEMFGAIRYYYRYYVPQVLAQADQILCNSEATARDVSHFYGISARKITTILHAYNAQHFRPVAAPIKQLQRQLQQQLSGNAPNATGQPDRFDFSAQPYFLMVGRQAPYKNIKTAIIALQSLPDYALLIAGPEDPRYTPELKALAQALGVAAQVKFLSYVPYAQLPALLSGAIALIFSSLWEGFGVPVLEAMACGTPVITSRLASLPEVAGDAAYFVHDPTDAVELGKAMAEIADSEALQQELSERGLVRSRQFSWEKTGQATAAVLAQYQ